MWLLRRMYLEGKLDGVTDVGDSLEALLEVEPDLIITQITQAETVDKYAKIAPTVAMPYNRFASIQEEMRYFGDLLDKKDVAEQWIADFERKTGKLREAVQGALHEGETVSVMQEYDGTVFLFGPKSGRGGRIMYEILGAKPPAAIPEHMLADSYYEFSLEKLPEYTGDYLILTTNSTLEQLKADPIWGKLPPIRPEGGLGFVAIAGILVIACSWAVSWIFAFFGVIARTAASVQGISMLVLFPLTFLSNAFVPVETMPTWLQWFIQLKRDINNRYMPELSGR
ncbi:ABC transporter substrate-binding protein [Brevibacillus parabrevis]|uniref:ABC transporter substrate-binding protein n=1 Tax=Brevibacillus parabrevis TaxID=54914 RepID=UPI002E20ECC7|nr:ABC transporter substrate-binding protein [Brevibacillus parabrevis]